VSSFEEDLGTYVGPATTSEAIKALADHTPGEWVIRLTAPHGEMLWHKTGWSWYLVVNDVAAVMDSGGDGASSVGLGSPRLLLREHEHRVRAARMTPQAEQLAVERRAFDRPAEEAGFVQERILVSDAESRVDLVEGREESTTRNQHLLNLAEAADDRVERQVCEYAMRERVVELAAEAMETEAVVLQEHRASVRETRFLELLPSASQQPLVDIEAEVVAWLQVANEMDSGPQAPAAHIEEVVVRLETLLDQELELAPSNRFPHAADRLAMVESAQAGSELHLVKTLPRISAGIA
jgi:hypothetical protein